MSTYQVHLPIDAILSTVDALNEFSAPYMLRTEAPERSHADSLGLRFDHMGSDMPLIETTVERKVG